MSDLFKAMNPTAPLTTEAFALQAAKVSAIGMVLGAIKDAVVAWYATTPASQEAAGRMVEQMTGQTQSAEQLAQGSQFGLYIGGFFILLQLVLAFVQWRKPNGVLPIIFLVLVIWSLGTAALALFVPMFSGGQPMWMTLLSLVLMIVAAVLHIASIRANGKLDQLRMDAAR